MMPESITAKEWDLAARVSVRFDIPMETLQRAGISGAIRTFRQEGQRSTLYHCGDVHALAEVRAAYPRRSLRFHEQILRERWGDAPRPIVRPVDTVAPFDPVSEVFVAMQRAVELSGLGKFLIWRASKKGLVATQGHGRDTRYLMTDVMRLSASRPPTTPVPRRGRPVQARAS